MSLREIGQSGIRVSSVAMGCWPIAGMTSLDVTEESSLATLESAWDEGICFFDTAFAYGRNGESEQLLGRVMAGRRKEAVLATKGGVHWDAEGKRVLDASPARLRMELEISLRRLGREWVDVYFLHAPDPSLPLEESAGAMKNFLEEGKIRAIGVSNVSLDQLKVFQTVCRVDLVQPPYNLLHREIERELLPYCVAEGISVAPYWPLMKGLLAGKLSREHVFEPQDGRAKYPMFQGVEWQKNQDFLDDLREIARRWGVTVAELSVGWVLDQRGIVSALCGAKYPQQIREVAGAMRLRWDDALRCQVGEALARRGEPRVMGAV